MISSEFSFCEKLCNLQAIGKNLNLLAASHLGRAPAHPFASVFEEIFVEPCLHPHHLLPLAGDQHLVEEQAVGEGGATIELKVGLWCREEQLVWKSK